MAKLASGRVTEKSSELLDRFNASLLFDKKLYAEDIEGSMAHATMLAKQGILTQEELSQIQEGLQKVKEEIETDRFTFEIADEDIHMAIEKRLTEIIGDTGKKLHTARSRNDQVALDFRLYVQKNTLKIKHELLKLESVLLRIAEEHTETMLPGMTHLQHAQPINFAYHMLAYMSMFKRDIERLQSAYERNNFSPIGCAALAGTPYGIDREATASALGFDAPTVNCLDTVSDRDFALDILYNIATILTHISRLSEELILWSSSEFGFIALSDSYSTSSSIMPQKKNPDVPELLRGKTGRVYGNLIALLTVLKGLPLAYNKDMQEDKEGVFDSVETALLSVEILTAALDTMTVNKEAMEKACRVGHLSATDLADYLVQKCGMPFRDAYKITGAIVVEAQKIGVDLSEMPYEILKAMAPCIGEDVKGYLDLRHSMNARTSQGGTATEATLKQISYFREWLAEAIR
ncbi:MAG: argininosuccinate lyase [Sulfurospirillum sp.]|nr:MAG: argininosuccinate lyase [Sulfurospirillum sp.]